MNLIDTHAHLDAQQFDPDREAVIQRAREAGVQIITMGTDLDSSERAVRLAQSYEIFAAVGIHPHEAGRFVKGDRLDRGALARLEALLKEERVVAVGEIGLDYCKNYSPRPAQLIAFGEQLALAQHMKKPVVIHNRNSEEDLLKFLKDTRAQGVVHSFTGDAELAQEILSLGLYIGINGIVTFPQSEGLRQAVKIIPGERLLLETDSPYLAPVPHRGQRNEPPYVQYVADCVAQLRNLPSGQLAQATTENARLLFALE